MGEGTHRVSILLGSITASAALVLAGCTPSPTADNPYPTGMLPVGDGKYTPSGPVKGQLYTCPGYTWSLRPAGIAGATQRGSWFSEDGTRWDPAGKPHIQGDIPVAGTFDMRVSGSRRVITTNGLPVIHHVGKFPVAKDDPVYRLDPNPNTITAHPETYDFPSRPVQADRASCIGHQVGVMTQGAALFSPLDAQGRDAVAWEVQDRCDGHPEPTGTYHYHGPSPCLPGTETDQVIGYALDGFPITGNRDAVGKEIFSKDLDECHGGHARITLDGEIVDTYRYVMTRDWPYTVACFRGTVEGGQP